MPLSTRAREHSLPVGHNLGEPACFLVITFHLIRCIASRRQQCRSEREAERQLLPISLLARRQLGHQVQAVGVAQSSLVVGEAVHRLSASTAPPFDRRLRQPRPREVMRDDPGLAVGSLRESIAKAFGNSLMQLQPAALEKGLIGRLLDQCVLESIGHLGRRPVPEDKSRGYQLGERVVKRDASNRRYLLQKVKGEFAPDRRADLRDLFYWSQTIEPCHQRVPARSMELRAA